MSSAAKTRLKLDEATSLQSSFWILLTYQLLRPRARYTVSDLAITIRMSDGRLLKPEKDFTKEADKQIQEAQELAEVCFYTQTSLRLRTS